MPARLGSRNSATSHLAVRIHRRREVLQRQREAIAQRPRLYAAIIALTLALIVALAWPFTMAHLQAIAVLDLVANKPVPTALRWLVTGPVTTTELTLPLPSGPIRARLY